MAEGIVVAIAPLQWVLTPMPSRKKWKMSLKSSVITVIRRDIMLPAIFKKMQKTSIGLNDLHADDWN